MQHICPPRHVKGKTSRNDNMVARFDILTVFGNFHRTIFNFVKALKAFFESVSFEDAIRNAVSIGGDSDTIAAITGSVAGIFYGIEDWIAKRAEEYLDPYQRQLLKNFEKLFC